MAKLKDDPQVQAILAKAIMRASVTEEKARKAQVKMTAGLVKDITSRHVEETEDKALKKALKNLGNDLLAAVKEA